MVEESTVLVDLQWTSVHMTRGLNWSAPSLNKYFNVNPHNGLTNQFNVDQLSAVVPHALRPTDGFHRIVSRRVFGGLKSGSESTGVNRVPYRQVQLTDQISADITSITAELFPGTLIGRVKASVVLPWLGNMEEVFAQLTPLRSSRDLPAIRVTMQSIFALAYGDKESDLEAYKLDDIHFGIRTKFPLKQVQLIRAMDSAKAARVGLLTGTSCPDTLQGELIEKVLNSSSSLNEKSKIETLLLNRLGFVYVLGQEHYNGPHVNRFERTGDMAILALFARNVLNNEPVLRQVEPYLIEFILSKLLRWIQSPRIVFKSSFSNTELWESLSRAFLLRDYNLSSSNDSLEAIQIRHIFTKISMTEWWNDPNIESTLANTEG